MPSIPQMEIDNDMEQFVESEQRRRGIKGKSAYIRFLIAKEMEMKRLEGLDNNDEN